MRSGFKLAIFAASVALLVGLALAGCSAEVNVGTGSEASGEEIAEEIRDAYEEETGVGLSRLTCEDAESSVGEEFNCTGRNARSVQLEISGKVTETTDDGFDYSWEVVKGIAPGVLFERALREQIEAGGVALSEVRCPVEVDIEVGSEIRCSAADRNGAARGVTVRLNDLDGGFDYKVDGANASGDGSSASS